MPELGIGLVGAGTIGKLHARALAGLDGARLVAVAEPREEAGRALAGEHGAAWHARLEDLLARPDVDAVVLCTPSGLHPEQAVAAAAAGKHVVTEKPMATTLAGADRMIRACDEAGVRLAVIFQYRFNRDALRLKRAVEAGLLGRPIVGNAFVHWHRTQAYYESGGWRGTWALDGGGALMNQSIHAIDLLRWVMGPVTEVAAVAGALTHAIETEDTATAALRFASGAQGVIQGTTSIHEDRPVRLEIHGTEGSAILEAMASARLTLWRPNRDAEVLSAAELTALPEAADEPFGTAHRRQLAAIVAALREGREPPVPGAEARHPLELILGIYRAARQGTPATFPLGPEVAAAD